jgi:hypothetical protein
MTTGSIAALSYDQFIHVFIVGSPFLPQPHPFECSVMREFITLFGFIALVSAQVTWNVSVGDLTFTPNIILASIGDTITFDFVSGNNSVTQSTFAAPCTSFSDSGIDSGFVPAVDNVTSFPRFSLTVTSSPLWFYCRQIHHCASGMVFAVNPSGDQSFQAFQAAAIATASDTNIDNSPGATTSPTATDSGPLSTDVPFAAPHTPRSASHLGLILGASIGGFLLVVIIVITFFYVERRMARARELEKDQFNLQTRVATDLNPESLPYTVTSPTLTVADTPTNKHPTIADLDNTPLSIKPTESNQPTESVTGVSNGYVLTWSNPSHSPPQSTFSIGTEPITYGQPPLGEKSAEPGTTKPVATSPTDMSLYETSQ